MSAALKPAKHLVGLDAPSVLGGITNSDPSLVDGFCSPRRQRYLEKGYAVHIVLLEQPAQTFEDRKL